MLAEVSMPVPPLAALMIVALQVPDVIVPTVAMSVPTNLAAVIEPASIASVTFSAPIVVALPTDVTSPVRFAFVVTVPAVRPAAVPVRLVATPLEGVPSAPLNNTNAPADPVLTANAVATPVPRPETPLEIGNPVQLVSVPLDGVPRAGVTSTGEVSVTTVPFVVAPVMPPKAPALLY